MLCRLLYILPASRRLVEFPFPGAIPHPGAIPYYCTSTSARRVPGSGVCTRGVSAPHHPFCFRPLLGAVPPSCCYQDSARFTRRTFKFDPLSSRTGCARMHCELSPYLLPISKNTLFCARCLERFLNTVSAPSFSRSKLERAACVGDIYEWATYIALSDYRPPSFLCTPPQPLALPVHSYRLCMFIIRYALVPSMQYHTRG